MPPYQYSFPTRDLVTQEDAAVIPNPSVPRARFIDTFSRLMTFDAGLLYPFLVWEVLPGDNLQFTADIYCRMSTPLFPLFSGQQVRTEWFFCPYRILQDNFVKMMGEQRNPSDSIAFVAPLLESDNDGFALGSIYDHMGFPVVGQVAAGESVTVNTWALRAYNEIWNQWYRDQNLQNSVISNVDDGPDAVADYQLLRRAKPHGYFESALPWPQKFTAPATPLSGTAPVVGLGMLGTTALTGPANVRESTQAVASYGFYNQSWDTGTIAVRATAATSAWPMVFADLSQATGVSINTFRQAFMIQTLLERDARGGTRYTELLRSHFGVTNPDGRLQRPEYIGGGSSPLNVTPIAQTAPTVDSPVGALGAAATATGGHRASYAATEFGVIIGLISIRTEPGYMQGLHRQFHPRTRYDFPWPSFAGLGEQAITRKEIFCNGNAASDETVYGYQERWHEYRTRYSEATGLFRSGVAGTLDAWHLYQGFATAPTLLTNLDDNPPMTRVLAAAEEAENQQYLAEINITYAATRPITQYGVPATLGRF